ncbi:MAG: prolyl oligopeptidase family serine peptidase [Gemmatimonadetes bacterium]|nr:prolyl oligopeptidase family serine peptidase [Gemmatimonadota bacterium]
MRVVSLLSSVAVAGAFVALPAPFAAGPVGPAPIAAQTPAPTLQPDDYDRWESLGSSLLDPTGRWLVVAVRTVGGDRELRLHPTEGDDDERVFPRGVGPVFTDDGATLVYLVDADSDADEESPDAARRLGFVDLTSATDTVLFAAEGFALSGDHRWIAARSQAPADSVGGDLTVLARDGSVRTRLANVEAFAWRDSGAVLAVTFRTASGAGNGVALYDPVDGALRSLDASETRYRPPTWRDDARDLAVLRAVASGPDDEPTHDVLVWADPTDPEAPAHLLAARDRDEFGDTLRVTETATLTWNEEGSVLFVGLRPWDGAGEGDAEPGDGTGAGADTEDGAEVEDDADELDPSPVQVWHWNDDRILRAQEYFAASDARRSHLTAWHLDDDRLVRLGLELDEPARPSADGRWAIVSDVDPYAFERRFGASTQDVYRIDVDTGARALLAEAITSRVVLGPAGARALIFDDGRWSVADLATLERTALQADAPTAFTMAPDDYDYPGDRPPYGVAAWSDDEAVAWLLDRHDVWEADLRSGTLERRTPGAEDGLQYRVVNLHLDASPFDPSAAGIDPDGPLWLSLLDPDTKASGYGRLDSGAVERLVFAEASISRLDRAERADRYVFVRERFDDSPDVFVTDASWDMPIQRGATNPFQSDYAWGHNELLAYTTAAGHDLHAILTYPADYDPSRRYPLILYQYERLSQGLHRYRTPSRTDYYNVQVWSQEGYFVLQPDIVYEAGRPGPSALDAIEHALDAALAAAPVDPERMGIVGHSWGGYQAAYVPTRMHRFSAAVAGAAITNFLSFPGSVHWNGGLPELGHWETGQARMAVPPWDDLEGHLESSPVAAIHELQTPVLLMHGDADGVVDFRQGLEYYNYARRLGKPVVMLVYPGADHGLRREENQVDYQRRILEWFGHYLRGDPPSTWITEGEPWDARDTRVGGR